MKWSEWVLNVMFDGFWGFEWRDVWMLYICIFFVGWVLCYLMLLCVILCERIKSYFYCLNNIFWLFDVEMYNFFWVFYFYYCDFFFKKYFLICERLFKYSCFLWVNKWRYIRVFEVMWLILLWNYWLISIVCFVLYFFFFIFFEKMCCCIIVCDKFFDFIDWSFWLVNIFVKNEKFMWRKEIWFRNEKECENWFILLMKFVWGWLYFLVWNDF